VLPDVNKRLAANTIWLTAGNSAKLVIQAAYFVIIARTLGPAEYGAFVAVASAVAVIGPFIGVGANILLIKNVSRDPSLFAVAWGNGLLVTSITGGIAFVALTFCTFLLPAGIGRDLLILIALSDLVFQRITDLSASAFGAHDRFAENAIINLLFQGARLGGLLWLVMVVPHPTVYQWAGVYLCASCFAAIISLSWATAALGLPDLSLKRVRGEALEGFYFSSGIAAQTVYNDIDKTIMLPLAGSIGAEFRRNLLISCLLLWAVLSFTWSTDPTASLVTSLRMTIDVALGTC
jgi:O-antigen/teichoic acid export membrane protein